MRRLALNVRFVLVEQGSNIKHLGDVVGGAAGDAMGLFGNADENGVHIQELERFVELLGFGNGGAIVSLPGHDECGRFDFGDEIGEGALHVIAGVVPRKTREPVFSNERDVGSQSKAVPIDDGIEGSGGAETFGILDGPAGKDAAAAATGDEEIVCVDVALGDDGIDTAVEVVKIVARISVMDEVSKIHAIAGASAGIHVENHVTSGGQHLFFKIETVAVVGERTAVNFKNKRIFLGRIEIRRVDDPALDLAIVFG